MEGTVSFPIALVAIAAIYRKATKFHSKRNIKVKEEPVGREFTEYNAFYKIYENGRGRNDEEGVKGILECDYYIRSCFV